MTYITPQPVYMTLDDDDTADAIVPNDTASIVIALDDLTDETMSHDDAAVIAMAIYGCFCRRHSPG